MKKKVFYGIVTLSLLIFVSCKQTPPPSPIGALPSEHQLAWHEMQFYAFIHFNMNTFTGHEWGFGDAKPETFNPTELDCRQWARVCKDAGLKGIIITAKHHDGFCLWPSKFTEYSVKNSPFRNGKGDVIRELSDACKEYGLKFGVYLSPWDRNHANYGKPEYIQYLRNQLCELLTNYGEVFEVWFDGANGGDGYYGGASEKRNVDRATYYDWENTYKLVYELQPHAIIFSDAGPGCRWVGNESGFAYQTNWCTLNRAEFAPGVANIEKLNYGQEDGTDWVPAEVDVSIRPGWYYHPYEDHKVKSLPHLLDIYYNSVGRGGNLLLNFPVDNRGLIHEKDAEQVQKLADQLKEDFSNNLALNKKVTASNTRGNNFEAANLVDGNPQSYWSTSDGITKASVEINLGTPTEFNHFLVQENIALGQRVRQFSVEVFINNEWQTIAKETTIGYKRILRLANIKTDKVRFTVQEAKACPAITNIEIYNAPTVCVEPQIIRDKNGMVKITSNQNDVKIYYTDNGIEPTVVSNEYSEEFMFPAKGIVKAITADRHSGKTSPTATVEFDIPATKWKVISPVKDEDADRIFDGDNQTAWGFGCNQFPSDMVIDLGEEILLTGFNYTPDQGRELNGIIFNYEFSVSSDGKTWGTPVSKGEFSNIQNSPVKQLKTFEPKKGRFVKFRALSTVNNQKKVSIAEFSVITK